MKAITTFLMAIGVIGILVFFALILGYFLFSLTPPIKEHIALTPVTLEAAQSFDQKFDTLEEEIEAAVAAKQNKEVTLTITEEEVNSKIVELLAEGKLPFNELLINFNDDFCWVYAVLDNPGVNAKIGLIAQLEVVEDDINVIVLDFHLGKLPLTRSVDERVSDLLNILVKMQDPTSDLPLEITDISITDKQFIVKGIAKGSD